MQTETPVSMAMSDDEFKVIEAALLKSPRGRFFLAEYVRRSQACETDPLDEAIRRLQTTVQYLPDRDAATFGVDTQQTETQQQRAPASLKIVTTSGASVNSKLSVAGDQYPAEVQRSPAIGSSLSISSTRPQAVVDADDLSKQVAQLYARSLEQAIDLARLVKVTASRGRPGGRR